MALKGKLFAKLGGILKNLAPTLLAATAGPLGPLAAGIAKKALGDSSMTDPQLEEAVAAATGTTEGLAKLKAIDLELQRIEAEQGIRFEELAVEDRKSARDLAVRTTYWPQVILSGLFVAGYVAILGLFFSAKLVVPMSEAFMVMLGVLTSGIPQILAFWLGSSSGSKASGDALRNIAASKS